MKRHTWSTRHVTDGVALLRGFEVVEVWTGTRANDMARLALRAMRHAEQVALKG